MWNPRTLAAISLPFLALGAFLALRTSSRPPAGPLAIAAASAAVTHVPSACELVAKGDIDAIVGRPLAPPRLRGGVCEYRLAESAGTRLDVPVVSLRVHRSTTKVAFEEESAKDAELFGAAREPMGDLGEAAIKIGNTAIEAYASGISIAVLRGAEAVDEAKATAIAARILVTRPASAR